MHPAVHLTAVSSEELSGGFYKWSVEVQRVTAIPDIY
jgi:hypothetical protein